MWCGVAASRVTYLSERSVAFCGIPFVWALPLTSRVEELLCLLGPLELGLMPVFPCVVMWYLYAESLPASVPHTHMFTQTQDISEAFQRKVSQASYFPSHVFWRVAWICALHHSIMFYWFGWWSFMFQLKIWITHVHSYQLPCVPPPPTRVPYLRTGVPPFSLLGSLPRQGGQTSCDSAVVCRTHSARGPQAPDDNQPNRFPTAWKIHSHRHLPDSYTASCPRTTSLNVTRLLQLLDLTTWSPSFNPQSYSFPAHSKLVIPPAVCWSEQPAMAEAARPALYDDLKHLMKPSQNPSELAQRRTAQSDGKLSMYKPFSLLSWTRLIRHPYLRLLLLCCQNHYFIIINTVEPIRP